MLMFAMILKLCVTNQNWVRFSIRHIFCRSWHIIFKYNWTKTENLTLNYVMHVFILFCKRILQTLLWKKKKRNIDLKEIKGYFLNKKYYQLLKWVVNFFSNLKNESNLRNFRHHCTRVLHCIFRKNDENKIKP